MKGKNSKHTNGFMQLWAELEKNREWESELPFGPVVKKWEEKLTESTNVSDPPSDPNQEAFNNSKHKLISNI